MRSLIVLLCFVLSPSFAAEPPPVARQEIAHLVGYLSQSGCQFNRNGSWYGSAEAADHVNEKYAYLLRRGWVGSADEFIARAASQSSMSGKPYLVRCGAAAPVESGPWLQAELARFRSAREHPAGSR